MNETRFGVLLACTILLQHLQIAAFAGYPVTAGLITGLALLAAACRRLPTGVMFTTSAIVVTLATLTVLLEGEYVQSQEFIRTLVLFLLATSVVALGFYPPRNLLLQSAKTQLALLGTLLVVVTISVLQTTFGMAGSARFFNLFGTHQYLYQYDPYLHLNQTPRAQGLFLEPSYNAFVIGTITVCLVISGRFTKTAGLLCAVGLLVTQSATGLIVMGVLLIIAAARQSLSRFLLFGAVFIAMYWLVGTYLFGRVSSIGTPGSSGNYRVQAPLRVLGDILQHHLLGYPLGSLSPIMSTYGLANGTTRGSSLDNGYYVLVFYFGWVGLILISVIWWYAVRSAYRERLRAANHSLSFIAPLWLLATFLFSGGVMLPEFAIMTWIILATYNSSSEPPQPTENRQVDEIELTPPERSHGYV